MGAHKTTKAWESKPAAAIAHYNQAEKKEGMEGKKPQFE